MQNERAQRVDRAQRWLQHLSPEASEIREGEKSCYGCSGALVFTYVMPTHREVDPIDETLEYCGVYCSSCGDRAQGARKRK